MSEPAFIFFKFWYWNMALGAFSKRDLRETGPRIGWNWVSVLKWWTIQSHQSCYILSLRDNIFSIFLMRKLRNVRLKLVADYVVPDEASQRKQSIVNSDKRNKSFTQHQLEKGAVLLWQRKPCSYTYGCQW